MPASFAKSLAVTVCCHLESSGDPKGFRLRRDTVRSARGDADGGGGAGAVEDEARRVGTDASEDASRRRGARGAGGGSSVRSSGQRDPQDPKEAPGGRCDGGASFTTVGAKCVTHLPHPILAGD